MSVAEVEVDRSTSASADGVAPRHQILILGEEPRIPAPTLTLARALARLGVETRFVNANALPRPQWIRLLRSAKSILFVSYAKVPAYLLSQLATAVAMDVPIIRWWVGTDVLNVVSQEGLRRNAHRLDRIVSANIAVAPHLVDELATAGFEARFVPSVVDESISDIRVVEWSDTPRPVLVYLPGNRKSFYGVEIIEPVIASSQDLRFIVVGDETHSLAVYPNVESLGWVPDMRSLYERAGCVLRITAHDGIPRMLIESMLRGLYAIYSWDLPGTWRALSSDDVLIALSRYRAMTTENAEGIEAMRAMQRDRPDVQMAEILSHAKVPLARRLRGVSLAVQSAMLANPFA